MAYTRFGPFQLNGPPAWDDPGYFNGLEDGIIEAQQRVPGTNLQTGTAYTLVLDDAGKVVEMSNASANTVTVPPSSSVAFPTGTVVEVCQVGAGQTSVVAGSGVTLRNTTLVVAAQWKSLRLRKRGTDEWVVE